MVSLATPILEDLSRETGESAHFSVRMGDAVVVLARTGGPGAFQFNDRAGAVRPAHCTALGKIMLAATAARSVRALSGARRTEGAYAEVDHVGGAVAARDRRSAAHRHRHRRWRVRCRSALRRRAGARFQRSGHRRHRHFRPGLAVVDRGAAEAGAHRSCRGRPLVGGIRLCWRA